MFCISQKSVNLEAAYNFSSMFILFMIMPLEGMADKQPPNLDPFAGTNIPYSGGLLVGVGNGKLHVGRAGPTRGPGLVPREVRKERWRPAKAPAGPADRH
jgi:hypothetical protein